MDFEIKIIEFLQGGRTPFFDVMFQVISLMGSFVGVVLLLLLLLRFRPGLAYWYSITYAIAFLSQNLIKIITKRERPFNAVDTIVNIGDQVSSYSMPSGHIVSACIVAVFLAFFIFSYYRRKKTRILVGFCLAIYVGLVGVSRMYLGKHYLTDLLVGMMLAYVISAGMIFLMSARAKRRLKNDNKDNNT